MSLFDFKCWFPNEGETEADARDVFCLWDAEEAAAHAVEDCRSGPDWQHLINGEPIRVAVLCVTTGKRSLCDVQVSASIDYSATEVGEGACGYALKESRLRSSTTQAAAEVTCMACIRKLQAAVRGDA